MWRESSPGPEQIRLLRRARERLDLYPFAIHANYLVNLASCDHTIRARSIAGFRGELQRAADLGAEYVVLHPGSYKGQSLEEGITAFVIGLREAAEGARRTGVTVLLENTVGCGAQIGGRFEELRAIRDHAAAMTDAPVGYCLDTCHLLGAGYDVASPAGLRATIKEADRVLGLENVKLMHANDSKAPLGSRLDRHANIGEGHIGKAGFRRILAHPRLRNVPFILETPVDRDGDDRRNLENLKELCPKSRTTTTKSS
jgi:deoxyribonuclease-4